MKKVFKVADIHELLKQVHQGEISYSRMVEIMNEEAAKAYEVEKGKLWDNPLEKIGIPALSSEIRITYRETSYTFKAKVQPNLSDEDIFKLVELSSKKYNPNGYLIDCVYVDGIEFTGKLEAKINEPRP